MKHHIIHRLDEIVVAGGFVNMVRRRFWPEYNERMFFWFNAISHSINVLSILLYEAFGSGWIIFPLIMGWVFVTNGFWHVLGTAVFREHSPGLMTSLLYWVVMYLLLRYGFLHEMISEFNFVVSAFIGDAITVSMIGSLFAGHGN